MKKQESKKEELVDAVDGVSLGTIKNRTRTDDDLGMMSTHRFEREEYERQLLAGFDYSGTLLTDADRKEVIERVLEKDPEKIISPERKHTAETERVKGSMSRQISEKRVMLEESMTLES